MPSTPSGTAHSYVRCSTSEQADSGLGIAAQKAAIAAYCKAHRLRVTHHADEGFSGTDDIKDRPGLTAALGALGRGDVLIVAKRDRLARDSFLSAWVRKEVKRKGCTLVSCAGEGDDETPTGRLLATLIEAFASFESDRIRERVKDAMAEARKQGRRISRHLPYGMRLGPNGLLERCGSEQRVVQRVLAMRRQKLALSEIGAALLREGLYPRGGGRWYDTQLRRIITRYGKPRKSPNDPTRPERSGARDRDTESGNSPSPVGDGVAAGAPRPRGRKGSPAEA